LESVRTQYKAIYAGSKGLLNEGRDGNIGYMRILGIETSCDETAAAVIEDGRVIRSNVVASQAEIHAQYGGIVPEVASRQHMLTIIPVVKEALEQANLEMRKLDGVAVTHGPGLAGSLLIGVNAAKGLALANELPFIGVNHLEGHIYAAWLEELEPERSPGFPLICLITSGGHTDLILMEGHGRFTLIGRTRDDAAGEAFDKAARVLGLGFPGGPAIQRVAESSRGREARFPRPIVKDSLDFSFSGLKTAVVRRVEEKGMYPPPEEGELDPQQVANVAAAFQEAIVDSMVTRTVEAAKRYNVKGVLLGGGVAANSLLRQEMQKRSPVEVVIPRPGLCTDNGAMIGAAAYFHLRNGPRHDWDVDVIPNLRLG
jgi:N6-L-threonylcarbamoyladenine synthase